MERLLVTGVDTLLGSNLALALAERCDVLGLYDRMVVESPLVRTARWHAGHAPSLAEHIDAWQPQWILHCGPASIGNWDDEPAEALLARESATLAGLAEMAAGARCRLAVLSSDAVFCGPRMFHDERSVATNAFPRAAAIRRCEQVCEQTDTLIVRTHAYGWSFDASTAGFAERAFEAITLGRPLVADGQRHATPILATDLAAMLWRAFELRLQGLYHLSGAERTSPHRFVTELAGAMGIAMTGGVCGCQASPAAGSDETSLSSKRARRALALATPMLRDGLNRFVAQAQGGWRTAWRCQGDVSRLHELAA